jgi:HSP20 family molecular chaperone IbpA
MAKKRSEPFSFPIPLSHEVEGLFDEIIHRPWGGAREARGWNPSVDLYETADAFVLEADLPGVKAENVKVEVQNGDLVLQGRRSLDQSHSNEHFHIMERSSGFFIRQMKLPQSVDKHNIQVEFKDGVLRVVLPKSKKGKGKNHDSGG